MKIDKRFKHKFKEIANSMGFIDKVEHVLYKDPITGKERFMLINNHKRFVKGLMALPIKEQEERIKQFEELQKQLEQDVASGKIDVKELVEEIQSKSSDKSASSEEDSEVNLGSDS